MRSSLLAVAAVLPAALFVSCSGEGGETAPALAKDAFLFDFGTAVPAAPPEMIALGMDLYHEKRLSTGKNLSCATCHDLSRYGQDGEATSPGSAGERGGRNSPSSVNAFRQVAQFWDGRAADVEAQAQGPVLNPIEHGFAEEADFLAALRSVDDIPARFAAVFPGQDDPVTLANFGAAVGAFERTLVTKGRWEEFLDGNDDALTVDEKKGLATFVEVGCTTCHNGRAVGGGVFQKLGLVEPFETADKGVGDLKGDPTQDYVFKVPMLLNVAETAPYFHDGSIRTLEEAVRIMAKHQLGRLLTDEQIASIVTFLKALTGEPQWPS
ncbi:MAG: cytochrome-c peroxidase [Planctomycetota bacterium]